MFNELKSGCKSCWFLMGETGWEKLFKLEWVRSLINSNHYPAINLNRTFEFYGYELIMLCLTFLKNPTPIPPPIPAVSYTRAPTLSPIKVITKTESPIILTNGIFQMQYKNPKTIRLRCSPARTRVFSSGLRGSRVLSLSLTPNIARSPNPSRTWVLCNRKEGRRICFNRVWPTTETNNLFLPHNPIFNDKNT